MPSRESSLRNLAKAKASPRYRRPRLFRSPKESQLIRSLVWQWLHQKPDERCSARKLASKLGVTHTWVNTLKRRIAADPERQARQERTWGPASLDQLKEERAKREGDYVRYRLRRSRRPTQPPDPIRAELEKLLKAVLKKQRDWKRDYGTDAPGIVLANMVGGEKC